jgi:hypothetical protein
MKATKMVIAQTTAEAINRKKERKLESLEIYNFLINVELIS